jgi:hypothetical protein
MLAIAHHDDLRRIRPAQFFERMLEDLLFVQAGTITRRSDY